MIKRSNILEDVHVKLQVFVAASKEVLVFVSTELLVLLGFIESYCCVVGSLEHGILEYTLLALSVEVGEENSKLGE